jgi:very-short-patch-repair endonuclease
VPDPTPSKPYLAKAVASTARSENNSTRLRADQSIPEKVLWSRLRNRQLAGFKFRRQHQLGPFVADFFCAEIGLVIELDSTYHNDRREQDAARDSWMQGHSLTVLRITAGELAKNESGVLSGILRTAQGLSAKKAAEKQ